jgi:hypothetical protein
MPAEDWSTMFLNQEFGNILNLTDMNGISQDFSISINQNAE